MLLNAATLAHRRIQGLAERRRKRRVAVLCEVGQQLLNQPVKRCSGLCVQTPPVDVLIRVGLENARAELSVATLLAQRVDRIGKSWLRPDGGPRQQGQSEPRASAEF